MRNNHAVKVAGLGLLAMVSMNLINVASLRAQNDADFKGKTIKVIVGTSAGGGVDLWARLIAQYIGRHLADEPALGGAEYARRSSSAELNSPLEKLIVSRIRWAGHREMRELFGF